MGEKKVKGRKRQIVVDTQGNLHQVLVHRANIHDSKGGSRAGRYCSQETQKRAKDAR